MMQIIFLPLLAGFILTAIFTPIVIKLAKKYGFVDDPKTHKHPAIIHTKPIPRAGGLPIFLSILIATLLFVPMSNVVLVILFAGLLVVIVGLLDDKYDLSPYLRFILNIVSSSIVVLSGVTLPFITNPFGGILHFDSFDLPFIGTILPLSSLPYILAIIWIVWVMNMLNWSKGVDGQMPGIAAISAIIIGISSLRFPVLDEINITSSTLSFIVAGGALGFLLYNFYPAKIFPGYSGTILGFMIGILSIMSSVKLATAILVLGMPMADAGFTIIRRIVSKKSPFRHDKGHLHHLLLDLKISQKKIAIVYWMVSLLLGGLSLQLSSRGKLFAILLLAILVSAIIVTLRLLIRKEDHD